MSIEITKEVTEDVVNILYNGYVNLLRQMPSMQEIYSMYKSGQLQSCGKYEREFKVLELLDSMGFPMNHPGTYFFKDLIIKIFYTLAFADHNGRINLIRELDNPFSNFYFDLARNDLDLGIKSFHEFVLDAFNNMDVGNADPDLLSYFESPLEENNLAHLAMCMSDYVKVGYQKTALGL